MASILDLLSDPIREILAEQVSDAALEAKRLRVIPSTNPRFGDYQFNGAMSLAKQSGRQPRELAQALAAGLEGMSWL